MNKKALQGPTTIQLFLFIIVAFLLIIFLGIFLWGFQLVDEQLDQNISVGQVNLQDVNNQTFGAITDGFTGNADFIGIGLILMMSFVMVINGWAIGRDNLKLWFVGDIFILIFAFIMSVYIAQSYETLINAASILDVYIDDLPLSSRFLLNLPLYVGTIGSLIMAVSYASLRRQERGTEPLGF